MKKILLTALLFCLMPFLGFSQQPTQTDEALFGPGPRSRTLPSHLQMNQRDGSDEIWCHAMFVSDPDHQYGYYYSIYENGNVVPIMMYNSYYFSAAEYYKPFPATGDDEIFPVWGYANDITQGFHRLMYETGNDNNTLSPVTQNMLDMTYDYYHDAPGREGRMLGVKYGKIFLVNLDWNTEYAGEAELLYDPADHPEVGRPITLACNLDGELFFITMSEDGITSSKLYRFEADDEFLEDPIEVGDLGWPAQHIQTMAFDHRNGDRLYWWQCDKDNNTNLVEIDPETASTTLVAATGTTEMAGLVFEYHNRPYTAYCLEGERGGILLKDAAGEYTAPQQDYLHRETVDFQVISEDGYSVTRLTVVKHGTDKVLLTIEAAELEDGAGSFAMPAYDVDLVGEWAGNEHPITYEWTPEGVDGLDISGPETGNFKDYVTISYRIDAEGYVLTGLTAQSGDTDIRVRKLSPNEDGKRYFRMPDGEVTVTGTYQEITLGQLEDLCQHSPAQVPVYSIPEGVTDNGVQVKKPESSDWVAFADGDWTDGDNFDVAGTWQYRVEVANDYGTFHSPILEFQVFDAPAIAIEGDLDYCEGSTLELNAVLTPDNTVTDGQLQWYKDGAPLSDATQSQLIIENVSADDAGDYTATYTTGEGLCQSETEAFAVNVHQLPEIAWVTPSNDTAVSLVTASLELQATPEGGTFFYKMKDAEERTEITGNTFTFPEAGEYELIYSYVDEYGCANEASVNAEVKQHHFIYYQENGNTNFPDNYTITGASEFNDGETTLLYAHQDDEVTVTVEVPDCNHLTGISIFAQGDDGSPFCILDWVNPSTNTFTITMPAQNSDGIPYYVTVNATWEPNEYNITYQWTPTGVNNLNVTGPSTGTYGNYVTVSFTIKDEYILTNLTAQSGGEAIDVIPLSPNVNGKRQFMMPDGNVTVNGTYQLIEIDSLPPVCQYQAPGMPVFNITSDNYTSYNFGVKKPGSGWTTVNDESYWENGNNFDVAGYWQYRVQITNGYGTFRSVAREFQVYEAPQSIAIDGETTLCQGGNLALTVVPTPDDAVMNGMFQWYKDGTLLPNYTQPTLAINNVTADAAGSYSATFLVGDDLCQFETEAVTVSVNQLPEITWVTPSNDTNDTIVLSVMIEALQLEATPAGGAFTYTTADAPETPITIEGGLLNPSEMGIGTYKLTYSYTDAETNCSAEASIDVKIKKIYWTDIEIRDNDWFNNCINNGFRYEITNARELGAFAALLNYYNLDSKDQEGIEFYTFDNDTVWIANDIDLLEEPYYFRPLNEFCGTLNGLGHVIDNMVIDEKNLIMVFNQYSRIDNIGFLNAKITNEGETKAAIDIKGTMYNSYFTNPELNNIEFNFNPTGDVQNVYYYNGRGEETVSKYICRKQVDYSTVDVTPSELLTGEGQNEGTGYLADWVWLQNKNDYYSWKQDPVGDETGNYGYPVMDTSFMHHHYVYILSDYNNGCKLGGNIKNRIIGDDEYVYAMNDDTITLEFTEYFHGIIDTVMIVARNYSVEGYDLPIEYSEEDGIITFVMPADNLYDEAYDVLINIVSHKDYWTDSPNYDATWFSNGRNPSSGVWEIRSNEQLAAFAKTILDHEYDFEDEIVWINGAFGPGDEFQKGRLNMVAHLWKPIDGFRGILDGGGFIIDSLDIREDTSYMMGQMGAEAIVCNLGIQDLMIPDSSYVFNNKAGEGHIYNSYITKNTDTDNSIYYIACEGAHVENTYILNPEMVDFNGNAIDLDDLETWVYENQMDELEFMDWCGDDINFNYGYPFHEMIADLVSYHIVHLIPNPATGGEMVTPNNETSFYMHDIVHITCIDNDCMHLVSITVRKTNGTTVVPCWTTPEGNYYFDMPPYDVDVVATWVPNTHTISYQWAPADVTGLNITGPSSGKCGSNVTVNYTYNTEGYILTGLTAQSGNDNIDVIPLSPNQDGKRRFAMPDGFVTVTGTYQEIALEQLDDICLNSPSQAPSYSFPEGVTDNGLYVKKPGSDDWTAFAANDWTDGDIFDTEGIWQYRVEVSNEYGTFHSATLEFQVLDDSSIAIEGDSDYCEGNTLELSAVPTSANAVLNGQFQWYKDGTLIPDATQSQLLIENVNPDHAGDYSATYTVGESLCSIETEAFAVNVHPLPEVAWVQPSNDTNDTIELSMVQEVYQLEATPAGGSFTYTTADAPETVHTIEGGLLNPSEMGVGTFRLTYSYTDTTTQCSAEASIDVKITKSYWTDDGNYNEEWFDDCINDGRRFEIAGSRDLAAFARKIMADHYGEEPYYFWNEQLNVPDTVFIVGSTYVEEGDYQIEDITGFLNMENHFWMPVTGFRGVLNGTHLFIGNLNINEELSAMFIDMSGDVLNLGIQDINMPDGSAVFATTSDDVTTGTVYNSHFTNATGHRNFTIDDGNYTLVNNYLVDSLNNQTDGRGNNVDIASLNTWGMTQPLDFLQHLYGWVTDSSTESEQINYGYEYHAHSHILPGFAITYHPDQAAPENGCYINGDYIAQEGTDVKVSISPATGYYCSTLVVVDQNENSTVLQQQNNEAHFTMPNGPVDVYATFTPIEWAFTLYFMIEGTTNSVHNPYTTTYHYQDEISITVPTITGLVPLTDPYTNTMPNAALTDTVFYSGDEFEVIFCEDIETMSCVNSYGTSHTNNTFQAFTNATVNVELEAGCAFNMVITNNNNGEVIYSGGAGSITFEMPTSDVSVCIDITSKAFLGINNNSLNVSLYPNPTSDEVKILCDEVKIDRVTVYDILGQIVLDNEINGNETILHLKDAAPGMYLVKITTEQGFVIKKLMVE